MNITFVISKLLPGMITILFVGAVLPAIAVQADDYSLYAPIIHTTDIREIAFVSGHIIHTIHEDGSHMTPLLPGRVGYDPDYSPDGEKIAFGAGLYSIMVMNADGTGATSLGAATAIKELIGADFVEVARPDWSPDGAQIAIDAFKSLCCHRTSYFCVDLIGLVSKSPVAQNRQKRGRCQK